MTKGAPQVILALSANAAQVKPAVDKAVNEFAARGFRSLGVARTEEMANGSFLVCCPCSILLLRDDVRENIATAQHMGVKVKMVTGDALAIAQEAEETGDGQQISLMPARSAATRSSNRRRRWPRPSSNLAASPRCSRNPHCR